MTLGSSLGIFNSALRLVHPLVRRPPFLSEQLLELLDRQSSILSDAAHSVGVDGVVSRDREDTAPIRHHDVLAFTRDPESGFLKGSDSLEVPDTGDLGH